MASAVFGFAESTGPASTLAKALGIAFSEVSVHRFPDGESLVRIDPAAQTAIVYRSLDDPNAKLVELLLAASALRENGAERVCLVAPYLAYMRQDMAFEPGQAVSQRVIGKLLAAHFDGVLTVDPHLHRISALSEVMPGTEAVSMTAGPALSAALEGIGDAVLVGPDSESRQWVETIAAPLGLDVLVGEKVRNGDREVEIVIDGSEMVAGRPAVLIDDVISSGATLQVAAGLLKEAGASRIEALATHCLADAKALTALQSAGIEQVRASDSVAGPTAQIPLTGLLCEEIHKLGWIEKG